MEILQVFLKRVILQLNLGFQMKDFKEDFSSWGFRAVWELIGCNLIDK